MASTTALALVLPAAMAIFACALMVLSRFNLPAAFAWGAGLGLCATGFVTSVMPYPALAALISDFFFIAGFFFYSEAFLVHFGMPLHRRERLAFAAIYLVMNVYVVVRLDSLHLELLLNDVATSCLLGFALVSVMNRAVTLADRAVVLTGSVVVVDSLIRVLVFVSFAHSSYRVEDFTESSYAQAMHVTTTLIGALYVLSIVAALAHRAIGTLKDAAERDPLTGLLNRRGFDARLEQIEKDGALRGSVIIGDIDHFKQVNDRFGHDAGDRVIQVFGDTLRQSLPANAIFSRFGGEEFVIFLPGKGLAEAGVLAQALRARFSGYDWRRVDVEQQITASFGVASISDGEYSAKAATGRADRALYEAKAAGRNKVVWDGGNYEPGGAVVDIQRSLKDEARRSADGA